MDFPYQEVFTVQTDGLMIWQLINRYYMQEEQQLNEGQYSYTVHLQPFTSKSQPAKLAFLQQELRLLQANTVLRNIRYADLVGFTPETIAENEYRITLNNYPIVKKFLRSPKRYIESIPLWLSLSPSQFEQLQLRLASSISSRQVKTLIELKLLIFLNPNAGSDSRSHFQRVRRFISYTNFTFDLVETTHRGHCKEYLQNGIEGYWGVLIISGDGLMHEFANSAVCGKVPVSHVPAGSGNAFAKTQSWLAGEDCTDEVAVFLAVKGRKREFTLMKMELEHIEEPIYSFLSLQWAFLADIDMNSEFLRILGGLRFEVYSLYRVLALRTYPGRITFSTTSNTLPPLAQPIDDPVFLQVETNFLFALFCTIPFISDKYNIAPLLDLQHPTSDLQMLTTDHGRWQLIKYLLASDSGSQFDRQKRQPSEGYRFDHAFPLSYRVQPLGEGRDRGIFGIDGESYEAQRMQASIADKKLLTFT